MKKRLSLLLIAVLLLSAFVGLYQASNLPLAHATGGITKVQGYYQGTTTATTTLTVTMGSAPTSGDLLVLGFSSTDSYTTTYDTISSISEAGVNWASNGAGLQSSSSYLFLFDGANYPEYSAIWAGIVGSSASRTITITILDSSYVFATADVCEWSGLITSYFLDKTASASGDSSTQSTGITGTTSQPNELIIGNINAYSQTAATNGFTLLDGAWDGSYQLANSYLYNIVSSTGAYSSAGTGSNTSPWAGCIATFETQSSESITITSYPTGSGFISVDSNPITTPYTFTWLSGDTHTLAATSPVSGGTGIQYVWSSWSDFGAQSHTYTVPSSSATVTASYTTQYYVTTSGDAYTTITASSWRNSGATPTITYSATSGHSILYVSVNGGANIVGTYPSSYTFPALSSPQSIAVATSVTTYTITVTSAYGNPTASGTAPSGTNYPTSVTSPQVINAYENAVCIGYSVDGGSLVSGTSYTFVDVTSGHAITYEWSLQYTSPGGSGISTGDGGQTAGGSIFDVMATNSSAAQAAGSGTSSNLVGYWALDEGSGTTAHDSSGNSNTGTLVNSPSWVAGKYGDALNFNGVSSYVQLGYVNYGTSITISAQINPSTTTIGTYAIASIMGTLLRFNGNGIQYWDNAASSNYFWGYTFTTGQWYNIVITDTGTTVYLYINGISQGAASGMTGVNTGNYQNTIGGYVDAMIFSGIIDDVRVYNIALSQTQVTQLYDWRGSTCTVSTVQPNFQSFSTTVSLYQGAIWYTGGGQTCWDAPTYDFNTGYLEYGVNYVDPTTGTLCPGWYVKISVIGGKAGTFSGSDDAYVELSIAWYDGGNLTKTDYLFCAYDAYRANDTTTQFELYINLWLSNQNGNSYVGGAVTAEYYGTTSTGWGPWSSWGPVDGLLCQSTFYAPLYSSNRTVIAASSLQSGTSPADFNVWTSIAKTGIGNGPYSDNLHVWATTCHDLTFNDLPSGAILVGMNAPPILPTSTPNNPVGIFAQIGNSITAALNTMSQTLSTMTSSASGVTASVLNSAFSTMGITNAVGSIQSYAGTMGSYFSTAVSDIGNVIIPIFTGIANFGMFVVTWVGGFINFIITLGTDVTDILTGKSFGTFGNIGAYSINVLGQTFSVISALIASGALFLFLFVWWTDSIDKRAKQYGGGWMSFFMSDIQNIISVLSFIFDMAWRIITTVISLGTQFLNLFL